MGVSTVEERGRILIPKDIREKLGLHGGEKMRIEVEGENIIVKPIKDKEELKKLKGCVEESKIKPMNVKEIWGA